MKIVLGCDHGGLELKNEIIEHLKSKGFETEDLGCYTPDSVDYPVYGKKVAHAVADGKADFGIVCCGTGIGISIAANKVKGIRCALPYSDFTAEMCRRHNNANMLAFGGRTTTPEDAKRYIDIFFANEYEGGRHQKRLDMLEEEE